MRVPPALLVDTGTARHLTSVSRLVEDLAGWQSDLPLISIPSKSTSRDTVARIYYSQDLHQQGAPLQSQRYKRRTLV